MTATKINFCSNTWRKRSKKRIKLDIEL